MYGLLQRQIHILNDKQSLKEKESDLFEWDKPTHFFYSIVKIQINYKQRMQSKVSDHFLARTN